MLPILQQILAGQQRRARPLGPPVRRGARPSPHQLGPPISSLPGTTEGGPGGILAQLLAGLHGQSAPQALPASAYGFQSSMPGDLAGYGAGGIPDSALGIVGGATPGGQDPNDALHGYQEQLTAAPDMHPMPPVHQGNLMQLPNPQPPHARAGNQNLIRMLARGRATAQAMNHLQRLRNHPALRGARPM